MLKANFDYTAQWILAYTGCFLTEDSCSWLVDSTTVYSIGMFFWWLYLLSKSSQKYLLNHQFGFYMSIISDQEIFSHFDW